MQEGEAQMSTVTADIIRHMPGFSDIADDKLDALTEGINLGIEAERRRCADIADRFAQDRDYGTEKRQLAEMIRNLILSATYDDSPTNPAHGGKIWK